MHDQCYGGRGVMLFSDLFVARVTPLTLIISVLKLPSRFFFAASIHNGMVSYAAPKENRLKYFFARDLERDTRASDSKPAVKVGLSHNIPPTAALVA